MSTTWLLAVFLPLSIRAQQTVPPEAPTARDSLRTAAGGEMRLYDGSVRPSFQTPLPPRDTIPDQFPSGPVSLERRGLFDSCGPFDVGCPSPLIRTRPAPLAGQQASPIRGFSDLGGAGSAGAVDGPLKKGNGTYRVLANGACLLSLEVKTGYMDIVFTLRRDSRTGKDAVSVVGRVLKDGAWKDVNGTNEVEIVYDEKKDLGAIRWRKDGEEKSERFWSGEDGDGRMTIEFGGGHNHDFKRGKNG